jgi:hypothetical protein
MAFIKEIAAQLEPFHMDIKVAREEIGKARTWIVLVRWATASV